MPITVMGKTVPTWGKLIHGKLLPLKIDLGSKKQTNSKPPLFLSIFQAQLQSFTTESSTHP